MSSAPPSATWLNRRSYPFSPQNLTVEGGRMSFIDAGQGRPVLFIHGVGSWSFQWRNMIRSLQQDGYRCVAPDLIGSGLSEKPRNFSYHPAAHSRNVRNLIETLDLRDITLVVHELGGPIGLNLVTEMPHRFHKIAMFNTWFWDMEKDPSLAKAIKWNAGSVGNALLGGANASAKMVRSHFNDKTRMSEEFEAAIKGPFESKDSRFALQASAKALQEANPFFQEVWRNRDAFVSKPTQFIWGTKDPVLGQAALDRAWHTISLAEATSMDAGSFVMEERAQESYLTFHRFMRSTTLQSYLA